VPVVKTASSAENTVRHRRYNSNWNQARVGGAGLEQLQELLAALRAAYLTYRTAHWQARGDASYGDHLMLQRIYEESEKHVDQVGERIVGYYGVSAVDLSDQTERVAQWSTRFSREHDPVRASLTTSESVRDLVTDTYDVLQKHGHLSLGIDDMLMSISSSKDEHVYLLQQALDGRQMPVSRAANYTSADLHEELYGTPQHPMDPAHPRWKLPGAEYPDPSTTYPSVPNMRRRLRA
jgi:DNA-binding ferritin-like protein